MIQQVTPRPHHPDTEDLLQANIRVVWNKYTLFLGGMLLYAFIAKSFGGMGGISLRAGGWEVLFILYLFIYFNQILRPSRWRSLLAATPILLAYIGQDIYYLIYGKVFRIVELAEIPELFDILPLQFIGLLFLALLPLLFFIASIDYRKIKTLLVGALPLALLLYAIAFFPQSYATTFNEVGNEVVLWSDAESVENNGYFSMLLYREAQRKISMQLTEAFRNRAKYDQQAQQEAAWLAEFGNKKNVHLIVMESLLDPTLFTKAKYSANPIAPDFAKFFGNKLGFSIGPVFGGGTAQAEFEVLCGVPAFHELAGIEFNEFSGAPAYCMPGLLGLAGYRSMASNAFKPDFFNAIPAYQGIGFDETFFPKEYLNNAESYLSTGDVTDEEFMFDGILFTQNLKFIATQLKVEDKRPIFNYVLSMYGHMPHILNKQKRPMRFKLIAKPMDEQLERSANQFYYRTQAIADYVNELIKLDKNSIIILVSDHVPPLQFGPNSYRDLHYLDNRENSYYHNRIMIIEDGKAKKYAKMHHYDIEKIIFNYLTDGEYCKNNDCDFMQGKLNPDRKALRSQYLTLMAHAME